MFSSQIVSDLRLVFMCYLFVVYMISVCCEWLNDHSKVEGAMRWVFWRSVRLWWFELTGVLVSMRCERFSVFVELVCEKEICPRGVGVGVRSFEVCDGYGSERGRDFVWFNRWIWGTVDKRFHKIYHVIKITDFYHMLLFYQAVCYGHFTG